MINFQKEKAKMDKEQSKETQEDLESGAKSNACETSHTAKTEEQPAKEKSFNATEDEFSEVKPEKMCLFKRCIKRFNGYIFSALIIGGVAGYIGGIYQFSVETQAKVEESKQVKILKNEIGILSLMNVIAIDRFNNINKFAIAKGIDTTDFLTKEDEKTDALRDLLTENATLNQKEDLKKAMDEVKGVKK